MLCDRGDPDDVMLNTFAAAAIISIVLVLLIRPKKELSDREPATPQS
jgi:hypothetical protein